jgi:hypothetical protein
MMPTTIRLLAPKMALHAGAVTAAHRFSTIAEQDPSEEKKSFGKEGTEDHPSDPLGPQLHCILRL